MSAVYQAMNHCVKPHQMTAMYACSAIILKWTHMLFALHPIPKLCMVGVWLHGECTVPLNCWNWWAGACTKIGTCSWQYSNATCIATVFVVHTFYNLGVCETYWNDTVVTKTVHVRISMEGGKKAQMLSKSLTSLSVSGPANMVPAQYVKLAPK